MQRPSITAVLSLSLSILLSAIAFTHKPPPATNPYAPLQGKARVVIDKSEYQLHIYDDEGWYATYPVVFGNSELTDKMMEGDRRTPEGSFKIIAKKIHHEWGPFLLIDYPNRESVLKFEERKRNGLIPPSAKIGGGIGIHGTRVKEDRFVDYYYNWTLGCISAKRQDAKELYELLPIGTAVEIRP